MSEQEYKCRSGCTDFEDGGEKACEECVASWKEHIRLFASHARAESQELLDSLPVYLRDWKVDHDKRWKEMLRQHDEDWRILKESLPKRGEFAAARKAGIAFYLDIDLEEWK